MIKSGRYRFMFGRNLCDNARNDFIKELAGTFSAFILSDGSINGFPEHILTVFIRFNCMNRYYLDFELDKADFKRFEFLNFSSEEWMLIYGLFNETLKLDHRLNPFIYLFFYDLIYSGPFGEDIEALDMSDELLGLMGSDMLRLCALYDEYFESDDSNILGDIVEASKAKTIPAFVVIHLANRIEEHVGVDKKEFGDLICELYVIAICKIYEKPKLSINDHMEISSICFEVDTSNFTDIQIDYFYSTIGKFEIIKKRNSMNRRIPNPRYRC